MSNTDRKGAAFGARLRLAREQAGLSQGQVARMLHLHRPSISEAEAGRRKVSAEELVEFARIYGVSISWLAGAETEGENAAQDRIELAARELAKLKPEDLDRLLELLSALRTKGDANP
jgi:transcriptional regulator with XRE-family HTH domain